MSFTTENTTYPNFSFKTQNTLVKRARHGILNTPHGHIKTPAFIFCATKAALKNIKPNEALRENTQMILANTYHLLLNGGAELAKKLGGINKMMNWSGPMLTDSGGFQIFSFGHGLVADEIKGNRASSEKKPSNLLITENGAEFRSYIDGSKILLTPELSIETQQKIGADLIVAFDECTAFHSGKDYTSTAMHRSHRWETRSLEYFTRNNDYSQAMYGIVQGGIYEDLRQISCDFVNASNFFGSCIGGSLGQDKEQMYSVVDFSAQRLDPKRPIHLLGIGGISDIFNGVECGVDTFDCVHPTRIARHGCAILSNAARRRLGSQESVKGRESVSLKNAQFKNRHIPLDESCGCLTCQNYSASYLNYLIKAKEDLFKNLLATHNIFQMNELMSEIRKNLACENLTLSKWEDLKIRWC